jgi:flavorubredoxin
MGHWPEVHITYEEKEGILFSADAFGKFGVMGTNEPWDDEARRYYIGIVGMHGAMVQTLLKKAATLKINKICPLHGEIIDKDFGHYLDLYDKWSSFKKEKDGICIAYTTVYGHMKEAVEELASLLKSKGRNVEVFDLARCDMSEALAKAFMYENIVLATTTYNNGIFPFMNDFTHRLIEHKIQNKNIAIMEGGTWAPQAGDILTKMFKDLPNIKILEPRVTVLGSLNTASRDALTKLASTL